MRGERRREGRGRKKEWHSGLQRKESGVGSMFPSTSNEI